MLRTALTPRLMGLFALMAVLVTAFVLLGRWQWGVAVSDGHSEANARMQDRPTVAITQVMAPAQEFPRDGSLRPVQATGRYDATRQELVAGRTLDGRAGFWVLTPLMVDGSQSRLPVVRGFVTDPTNVPGPTTGTRQVTVTGALAPGESPQAGVFPKGQIGAINLAVLTNTWGGSIYNAFIFATNESPTATAAPVRTFAPPQPGGGGFHLLNASYAVQWMAFAGFAIYVWVRMVRDEHDLALAGARPDGPEPGDDDHDSDYRDNEYRDNAERAATDVAAAGTFESKERQ